MANPSLSSLPWPDVIAVGVRTTADGPFAEDVFWKFLLREGGLELPGACVGGRALDELHAHLPGLDSAKLLRALTSTRERVFRIWHHEESRFVPDRDELAARFRALVVRVGGAPGVADAVFQRVYGAWGAAGRRYHDLEHLVDCLRELDAANAPAPTAEVCELALWYHDVVYEPGARDCEARSAIALLGDARELAIPSASAQVAAEQVRATAHGPDVAAVSSVGTDLVCDIDLSILGRDPLRFMDYEYGVEEEYSAVPTLRFRAGRGRFLAALLDRPHLFRTERFRSRYEQRARQQIAALLAGPRYRS